MMSLSQEVVVSFFQPASRLSEKAGADRLDTSMVHCQSSSSLAVFYMSVWASFTVCAADCLGVPKSKSAFEAASIKNNSANDTSSICLCVKLLPDDLIVCLNILLVYSYLKT